VQPEASQTTPEFRSLKPSNSNRPGVSARVMYYEGSSVSCRMGGLRFSTFYIGSPIIGTSTSRKPGWSNGRNGAADMSEEWGLRVVKWGSPGNAKVCSRQHSPYPLKLTFSL